MFAICFPLEIPPEGIPFSNEILWKLRFVLFLDILYLSKNSVWEGNPLRGISSRKHIALVERRGSFSKVSICCPPWNLFKQDMIWQDFSSKPYSGTGASNKIPPLRIKIGLQSNPKSATLGRFGVSQSCSLSTIARRRPPGRPSELEPACLLNVCVCIYIYIYIYTHTPIDIRVYVICLYIYIYSSLCVYNIYVHMYVYIYIYIIIVFADWPIWYSMAVWYRIAWQFDTYIVCFTPFILHARCMCKLARLFLIKTIYCVLMVCLL